MAKPTNLMKDSFKHFTAWLAALFLVVLGAKLWVVQLYGSPLPLWDQWYEAVRFFRPWVEGRLTWQALFAADNGHRIVCSRLFDFILIKLNGRWEPMLQMTANAFVHTTYVCGLAFCLWDFLGRKNGWFVCFLLAPFFALPYAGENAIWAITLEYFLDFFSLATLVGLGFARPGSRWWWLGLAAACLSLFTMASGLLASVTVGALAVLRVIKLRRIGKENLILLSLGLAIVGLGLALSVKVEDTQHLNAQTLMQFVSALVRNLSWPFFNAPGMVCLLLFPLVVLAVWYLRPGFPEPRAAEFLLTLALWGGLQAVALAYGRGNYGDVFPVSRYLDILNVFVIASLFASALLAQLWLRDAFSAKFSLLLPLIFCVVICTGLCRISQIVVENLLLPTRMMNLVAEERVTTLWTTGGTNAFFQPPTVRPDPEVVLEVLRTTKLQTILPAVCLPPDSAPTPGRFDAGSQWLLRNSTLILYGGLGLCVGLIGYGLIRNPLGLALENIPAFAALLILLAALGFVWSKAPIQRETIERTLQYELADYFKSIGDPERAAIHEKKAEALKKSEKLK